MLMLALFFALASAQVPCPSELSASMSEASARAQASDLRGAIDLLMKTGASGCPDAVIGFIYLQGLLDARDAYARGAPPESLAPVKEAIAALESTARGQAGPAEIARLMLQAAAAAAQSERDEMALYLEHAERMDELLRAAGEPAAPVLSAAEVSGELWLEVQRYDDAERAFRRAAGQVGMTPRVVSGLARVAAAR